MSVIILLAAVLWDDDLCGEKMRRSISRGDVEWSLVKLQRWLIYWAVMLSRFEITGYQE